MALKTFCKYVVIIGTLIIWTVKFGIRPYFNFSQPTQFLLGIIPNLMGAFLLPFGCCWLLGRYINLHNGSQFKQFAVLCFVLLCINELLQLIPFFGRTFDYNDIAASAIGLTTAYFLCSKYVFRKLAVYP
jgi:hypothetical protein